MKDKPYSCSLCNTRFNRKWNAFRHNERVHNDLARIENKQSMVLKNSKRKPSDLHYSNIIAKHDSIIEKLDKRENEDDIFHEIDKIISEVYSRPTDTNLKVITIAGQLITPFEELEKMLSYYDPKSKLMILTNAFNSSLKSYNPVKSLRDTCAFYKGITGINRIAKCFADLTNQPPQSAINFVNSAIRNSNLYDRINN